MSLDDEISRMLIEATPRVGGQVGEGSQRALAHLRLLGLIGPNDGLSREGLKRVLALQKTVKEKED